MEPNRIYTKDAEVWTLAGVTAGIDTALAMVAEDVGRNYAIQLAKMLVVFMARPGGQSQFSSLLRSQSHDVKGKFDDLHSWIMEKLYRDLRVEVLADRGIFQSGKGIDKCDHRKCVA